MTDTATATTPATLLSDDQLLQFIVHGYLRLNPTYPAGLHADICRRLEALPHNPGNAILDAVPPLQQIWQHPEVVGALRGLVGDDYRMHGHRHWHTRPPHAGSQGWHQDGTNVRHHQTWSLLAMYYPHDVSLEMGPTMVMPGTHLRNAPTDRLASYANFTHQVALAVPAGTVVLAHYDIWHAGSANRTEQTRSMLKFVFDRQSEPTAPTWDHHPETVSPTLKSRVSEQIGGYGYCSDYYKEWELRLHMWRWHLGDHSAVPPGHFKDLLA